MCYDVVFDNHKWQKKNKTIIFNYYLCMSKKSSTFAEFVENQNVSTKNEAFI